LTSINVIEADTGKFKETEFSRKIIINIPNKRIQNYSYESVKFWTVKELIIAIIERDNNL
jgi:hypothetical protein